MGVAVGKAAQRGLADDACQAAYGDDEAHLAVGKAAALEQRGLVGADGGKHGPETGLHGDVVVIQATGGGESLQTDTYFTIQSDF